MARALILLKGTASNGLQFAQAAQRLVYSIGCLEPGPQGLTDPGRIAVSPCRFDQGAAGASIAGEREARPANRVTGRAQPRSRPRKAINCGGVSKRRTCPISAANISATRNEAPRMA